MDLKGTLIRGTLWSFIQNFGNGVLQFVISIILARLLFPDDFGVIGMVTIFIAFSQVLINGGMVPTMIQRQDITDKQLSSILFFNMGIAIFAYLLLFFTAPLIAGFYGRPELVLVVRIIGLTLIFSGLSIVHRTLLIKKIDYKTLSFITLGGQLLGGATGIVMALNGYSYWSLVGQILGASFMIFVLLWIFVRWTPRSFFSASAFKPVFSFGYKILLSEIINVVFDNLYYVLIGKLFSSASLGLYSKSRNFQELISTNIDASLNGVLFPGLSKLQDDKERFIQATARTFRLTMMVSVPLMIGLAFSAEQFIGVVLGDKWLVAIPYFRLFCIAGILYPMHTMNMRNIVLGKRPELLLKVEIIKKILLFGIMMISIWYGLLIFACGHLLFHVLAFLLNAYYSNKAVKYSMVQQLYDSLPALITGLICGAGVYAAGYLISTRPLYELIIQFGVGLILYFTSIFVFFPTFKTEFITVFKGLTGSTT